MAAASTGGGGKGKKRKKSKIVSLHGWGWDRHANEEFIIELRAVIVFVRFAHSSPR